MAEVKVNQVVAEVEAGVQMKDKVTVMIIKWEKLMWWRSLEGNQRDATPGISQRLTR